MTRVLGHESSVLEFMLIKANRMIPFTPLPPHATDKAKLSEDLLLFVKEP
jgi:hypothetical protein